LPLPGTLPSREWTRAQCPFGLDSEQSPDVLGCCFKCASQSHAARPGSDCDPNGITAGIDASVHWTVTHRWALGPGYSYLQIHLHTDPTSLDTTSVTDAQGSNPIHQVQL